MSLSDTNRTRRSTVLYDVHNRTTKTRTSTTGSKYTSGTRGTVTGDNGTNSKTKVTASTTKQVQSMTDFRLERKKVNSDYCSSYLALYMLGEYGIEVGYSVPPVQVSTMNKELLDWQEGSDCCALCGKSALNQGFTITSYAVLSPNPCTPLVPLFAGDQCCPCFVNPALNNQATNCWPQTPIYGTCCN